jgi:Protein of unknown function (DUF3105)
VTSPVGASPRRHVPILAVLALLLPIGPIGWAFERAHAQTRQRPARTLAQIARAAGCRLTEFHDHMDTNPPVTGRLRESAWAADGSYAGRRPPSLEATIHAMLHGRVIFQYRRDLPPTELRALDRLTRADPDRLLLVRNQTEMPSPVAATAYLSLITCHAVDGRTLAALAAFRERRRGFGQSF